jgi:hypothetical protein
MQKNLLLTIIFLSVTLLLFSFSKITHASLFAAAAHRTVQSQADTTSDTVSNERLSLSRELYDSLKLEEAGLSFQALDYAIKGYNKLVANGEVSNSEYLSIADMSQSSRKKRFYLLDVKNFRLMVNTFVAHGRNSGIDEAVRFSNSPNSNETSLGFYITKGTYRGKHGLSLRLSGLENGFNSNAESRGIVVHGAPYVNDGRAQSEYMGRSQGCPALPENEYTQVISLIKDGSVLFVYHPDGNYINESPLLNNEG